MDKDKFYSRLFKREIHRSEPEYQIKVLAESLYRYYILEKEQCTCMECRNELKKLKEYLSNKIK
jgi:hypothetical protein